MRSGINGKLYAGLMVLIVVLQRWPGLPAWILFLPLGLLAAELLVVCYLMYQRWKSLNMVDKLRWILRIILVIGLVTAPLLTGMVRIEVDAPAERLACLLFYFTVVGLMIYAIAGILGFLFALGQKTCEKEELEDAKKY